MPIEWLAISAQLAPFLKKFVEAQAMKLASQSSDRGLAVLYRRFVPERKLLAANEAFISRFSKEIESSIDLPTVTAEQYERALTRFLENESVQDIIQAPLDGSSGLKWEVLRGIWSEFRDANADGLIQLPLEFDWRKMASTYQQAIQRLMLADPELRPILQALASVQAAESAERTATAVERLAGPQRPFDLGRYAAAILKTYSYLRLGSLDADWTDYESRVRLTSVYVPQSVKRALPPSDLTRDYLHVLRTESRTHGVEIDERQLEKRKREYERLLVQQLTKAVRQRAFPRIILLGDPGLGKSSFLKYLALEWAQNTDGPVTLLIELRKVGRLDFLEYMEKGSEPTCCLPQSALLQHLAANESLVLFDGLDEVPAASRDDSVSRIIRFSADYPLARIIVTTRIRGYHPGSVHPEQFADARFRHFTLQDFRPREVSSFIDLWHREAFQDRLERQEYESRLRRALQDSPAIRELAGNPLLLTIMAILSRNQDLPRDRARLYEKCAELLLKNWDLDKFPERKERADSRDIKDKLGPDQKMRILEVVAASMQEERTGLAGNLIAEERLKWIIANELEKLEIHQPWAVAEDLIWMLRERNFMLSYAGDRQYAFVHRTFLEYFCARDLKYRLEKTSSLATEELAAIFRQHWDHEEWLETLRLICGLIGPEFAGACISEVLRQRDETEGDRGLFLASQCLREIRELGLIRSIRSETRERLYAVANRDPEPNKTRWDEETLRHVRNSAQAVREIARGWRDDADTYTWVKDRANNAAYSEIRETALRELNRHWSGRPEVLSLTKTLSAQDKDWEVRQAALGLFVLRRPTEPDTMVILHVRAETDPHWSVRRAALRYLSKNWCSHPETFRLLNSHAEHDASAEVRGWATREIVRNFASDFDAIGFLERRATDEPEWDSRREVLRQLARAGKSNPEVLVFLKGVVEHDRSDPVKRAAVQMIARAWRKARATEEWLRERAVEDQSIDVRRTAIEELAAMNGDFNELVSLLKNRAECDDYAGIRYISIRKFAEKCKEDVEPPDWLKARARNDEHWDVRKTALDELASRWERNVELAAILIERAAGDSHPIVRHSAMRILEQWSDDPTVRRLLAELNSQRQSSALEQP